METFVRVTDLGELVEREWKNEKGEARTIASLELTLSNGLDEMRAETNDDLARNIAKAKEKNEFDMDGLYRVRLKFAIRESKEKKIKFNSIRILDMQQL